MMNDSDEDEVIDDGENPMNDDDGEVDRFVTLSDFSSSKH